jgi:hypothetical protein
MDRRRQIVTREWLHTSPKDIPKTASADIAGKVRDEISEELVGLAADVAKRELACRHGGHIEEPYATPGCSVFEPLCQPYCHSTIRFRRHESLACGQAHQQCKSQ